MSETGETTTGAGAGANSGAGAGGRAPAGAGAERTAAAETGGGAADTVGTASGIVEERSPPWFKLTKSPPAASNSALVIASLGIHPPEGDCFFAADNRMGGTLADFFSRFTAGMFFSRNGSRSRSAITSRMMSRSIVLRWSAHASDIALKQRLLILRGMPSLWSAISLRAPTVRNAGFSQPAIHRR